MPDIRIKKSILCPGADRQVLRMQGLTDPSRGLPEKASVNVETMIRTDTYTLEDLFLKMCRDAAFKATNAGDRTARLDAASEGDDEDMDMAANTAGSEESWMQGLAKKAWQVSCAIRSELMHTRLMSLLVEWCEIPPRRENCVCSDDLCVPMVALLDNL